MKPIEEFDRGLRQSFNKISDPGHGWLEVPRALLYKLNIADKISSYSYERENRVYLEEDCDAPIFAKAYTAALGFDIQNFYKHLIEFSHNSESPIRGYARYEHIAR